jgi:hypothetical protein
VSCAKLAQEEYDEYQEEKAADPADEAGHLAMEAQKAAEKAQHHRETLEAMADLQAAAHIYEQKGMKLGLANSLHSVGAMYEYMGDTGAAHPLLEQACAVLKELERWDEVVNAQATLRYSAAGQLAQAETDRLQHDFDVARRAKIAKRKAKRAEFLEAKAIRDKKVWTRRRGLVASCLLGGTTSMSQLVTGTVGCTLLGV